MTLESDRKPRVLIADDQKDVLEALRLLLKSAGIETATAMSPAVILARVESDDYDAAIVDMNYARDTTSGVEGVDLLARLKELDPLLPVLVMTAWGSVDGAVQAMRLGARDYIQKPWDNQRVLRAVETQIELSRALRRTRRLEGEATRLRGRDLPPMVAESRAMAPVIHLIQRVAPSDASVLITGEHGTGKEVVARRIHAMSRRGGRPFVAVNAGGLADGVLESELFGHVKGAFTDAQVDRVGCFELADGGTLFLDEIATMPVGQQSKLLRTLQSGEFHAVGSSKLRRVEVRLLAATNADLGREVAAGRFREDLLYRLNTVEIHLPPLRDRREDIPEIAAQFLAVRAARYGATDGGREAARELSSSAMQALLEHNWPGNVRELEHVIERACLLARARVIEDEDLMLRPRQSGAVSLEESTLDEAERYLIQRALGRAGGNVSDAARALGLSRSALYRRLQHYGLKASG
ncbi:MAG TPA: sigma-54 dependent transcriptional regulator [Kofleriaceae bacterium]|nr:sigma-54 dependent transcriptional regulator [Kofleriaceae bacterium]